MTDFGEAKQTARTIGLYLGIALLTLFAFLAGYYTGHP